MIVRKRRIRLQSEEISLQVSYGTPDVKQFVKTYRARLEAAIGEDVVKSMLFSERDITHFFKEFIFDQYEKDMRQTLASWVMAQAVAKGFLIESATKENAYFFSEELKGMGGRPKKE